MNQTHFSAHTPSEQRSELPLILFTLCAAASVGIAFVALVTGCCTLVENGGFAPTRAAYSLRANGPMLQTALCQPVLAGTSLVLITVGMIASVAHLAKPLRAPLSLSNVKSSWLSREILIVSAYWALTALWLAFCFVSEAGALAFAIGALAGGCALLAAAAKAYAVPGQPLWNGPDTFMELFAAACGAGIPLGCALTLWAISYTPLPLAADLAAATAEMAAFSPDANTTAALAGGSFATSFAMQCCSYLSVKATLSLMVIGPLATRILYARAETTRTQRVSCAESPTPREQLCEQKLSQLKRSYRIIMALVDASLLLTIVAALVWVATGTLNMVVAALPAALGIAAFYCARDRFYHMAVISRHAIRRNFR